MNPLKNLIGQTVNARIEIDDGNIQDVVGKVTHVEINDHYFYDKGEPIYITVSINSLGVMDDDIDSETLDDIPLECITKY